MYQDSRTVVYEKHSYLEVCTICTNYQPHCIAVMPACETIVFPYYNGYKYSYICECPQYFLLFFAIHCGILVDVWIAVNDFSKAIKFPIVRVYIALLCMGLGVYSN